MQALQRPVESPYETVLICDHDDYEAADWRFVIRLYDAPALPQCEAPVALLEVADVAELRADIKSLLHLLCSHGDVFWRMQAGLTRRIAEVVDGIEAGMVWLDDGFNCLSTTPAAAEMLGLGAVAEVLAASSAGTASSVSPVQLDSSALTAFLASHNEDTCELLRKRAEIGSPEPIEVEGMNQAGRRVCLSVIVRKVVGGYIATLNDATSKRDTERTFQHLTNYDPLTGLANRGLLFEFAQRALNRARRRERTVGLILVYLDFSALGDSGLRRRDEFMTKIAAKLGDQLREEDLIARWGSQEFAVILEEIARVEDARRVAENLSEILRSPFMDADGTERYVASSMGIAAFPGAGDTVEVLIQAAETAMLEARKSGRNTYNFYSSRMQERAEYRAAVEFHLRRSLETDQFLVYYQPKVSLSRERIVGFEALMRWDNPEWRGVGPADFIPVAEECGLIVQMGEWILRRACEQMVAWQKRHPALADATVAVNVSARQLSSPNFAVWVEGLLHQTGLAPHHLELELTESTLMEDPEVGTAVLHDIHALGVRLSIDDFGTGYSSLSYLQKLPIDVLKIDRCFVSDLGASNSSASIVEAILGLSASLGLANVAEGVESEAQVRHFHGSHCDVIQGYYFSKPLGIGAIDALVGEEAVPFRDKFRNLSPHTDLP